MAKISFNFGANKKPRKSKASKAKKSGTGKGRGTKGNAWRAYTGGGISGAPRR